MTYCPRERCGAPERPDHQSAVEVGSRMRLACLMGHSRWVELNIVTLAPRAIGKHEVSNRMYPPRDCLRCGFPIVPRLALNQKRHGRCAALETAERRKAKHEQGARSPRMTVARPSPPARIHGVAQA